MLHFSIACGLPLGSLSLGMAGCMYYEHLAWRGAFLNAAMLSGGMGPVDAPKTDGGKVPAWLFVL